MQEGQTQQTDETAGISVEPSDPAKRLYAVIALAITQPNNIAALEAWARTFGIDPNAANANPHEVVDQLRLMKGEVENLRRLMQKTHFSADLYEPALQAVLNLISVSNLAAGWSSYAPQLSSEYLLALRWCSQAIESESGLTHAELQRLLDAINSFKNTIDNEDLPESVREFIVHQIELMIRAIHQYPIIGRRAVREAIRTAAVDIMGVDDNVSSAAPRASRGKLAELWGALLATVEGGEKMVKAVTGIAQTVPKLTNAVTAVADVLP